MRDVLKRLAALEKAHGVNGCVCRNQGRVVHRLLDDGETVPTCSVCGQELACVILRTEIVETREEALAALAAFEAGK